MWGHRVSEKSVCLPLSFVVNIKKKINLQKKKKKNPHTILEDAIFPLLRGWHAHDRVAERFPNRFLAPAPHGGP